MTVAVGLAVSMIEGGQRSEGSGHSEISYNSLKCIFKTIYTIEL